MRRVRLPLEVVHACTGRLRLKAVAGADVGRLGDQVATIPGVERVLSRPATGSLIVTVSAAHAAVLARLAAAGLAGPPGANRPEPVARIARREARRLDTMVRLSSEGVLDLRSAVALLLLLGALAQAVRGNLAGPATALLLGAASLMNGGDDGAAGAGGNGDD